MLVLLLWLASEAATGDTEGWIAFEDAGAGFAVAFPGAPEHTRTSQLTLAGRIPTGMWSAADGATVLRVEVHGIPALARWILSEEALLERAAGDFLAAERAVSSQTEVTRFGAHPARRVTYRDDRGRSGRALFVLAGGRLYMQVALGPPGEGDRDRFFGSFALLPVPAG